jgi:hypothetical protein
MDLLQILLQAGGDISVKNSRNQTAHQLALAENYKIEPLEKAQGSVANNNLVSKIPRNFVIFFF